MVQKDGLQILLLSEVRLREIFPVSVLLNCTLGMSSPRAGRGQNHFQEC